MSLLNIVPVLMIFYIFLKNYHDFISTSIKINGRIQDEGSIREELSPIYIHSDNKCLYNHQNLCQKMSYLD